MPAARQRIEAVEGLHAGTLELDKALWLRLDSFALMQAIAYRALRLHDEFEIATVHLRRQAIHGARVHLDLVWSGQLLNGRRQCGGAEDVFCADHVLTGCMPTSARLRMRGASRAAPLRRRSARDGRRWRARKKALKGVGTPREQRVGRRLISPNVAGLPSMLAVARLQPGLAGRPIHPLKGFRHG